MKRIYIIIMFQISTNVIRIIQSVMPRLKTALTTMAVTDVNARAASQMYLGIAKVSD